MSLKERAVRLYLKRERQSWNAIFGVFGKKPLYPNEPHIDGAQLKTMRIWCWACKRWPDFPQVEYRIREE